MMTVEFKCWNNKMPMNQKFMAIANVELPHSGYSAKLVKVSSEDNQITLELKIAQPDPSKLYAQAIQNVETRFEDKGVAYKEAILIRQERYDVKDVS